MSDKDTAYKYRNDEMGLIRSCIDGSFNEDIYIEGGFTIDSYVIGIFRWVNILNEGNIDTYVKIKVDTTSSPEPFRYCKTKMEDIHIVVDESGRAFVGNMQGSSFKKVRITARGENKSISGLNMLRENKQLETFILDADSGFAFTNSNNMFYKCNPNFTTLVLNCPTVVSISAASTFDATPFYYSYGSGGGGGTIYIPESLYDHLGDGSEYDYKSATNWSVYDAQGHIVWAPIEGSEFENI